VADVMTHFKVSLFMDFLQHNFSEKTFPSRNCFVGCVIDWYNGTGTRLLSSANKY